MGFTTTELKLSKTKRRELRREMEMEGEGGQLEDIYLFEFICKIIISHGSLSMKQFLL